MIMDKYEEALQKARKIKHDIENIGCSMAPDMLEEIFPELAESEDERIRKILIEEYKRENDEEFWGIKASKIVAWLEKQKENIEKEYVFRPLAGTDITIAAEQAIRRANEGDRLVLAFNGAYIPVRKGCNVNKIVDIYDTFIEKQKEQKPVEWSDNFEENIRNLFHDKLTWHSEDGRMSSTVFIDDKTLKDIISGIWFYVGKEALKYPNKELNVTEWSDTYNIGWDEAFACVTRAEKAAKNEEELQNAVTAEKWLKEIKFKYCVHPVKQEWSEEDEEMLDAMIDIVANSLYEPLCPRDRMLNWLKSLRPSWKPSKEQMKALEGAQLLYEHGLEREDISAALKSLYNDLKEL